MEALTILRELANRRAGLFKIIILEEAYQEMLRVARKNPKEFCTALSELIGGIDLESSECTFENEKISILKQLRKMGTFEMLNFNISGVVEEWVFEMLRQMTLEMIEAGNEDVLFDFRSSLAVIFTERGRLHEALQQRELRLVTKYKLLDQHAEVDSVDVATHIAALADALLDVSESYARLNRFEDSLKFQQEAQKYCQRALHEHDLQHAKIMALIAQTYFNLDNGKTALQLMDCALQFHLRVLPQHDPRVFCAEAAVASMHRGMQDFATAFDLEKQTLEKRLQNLPRNHPDIGSSHFNIALTLPFIESLPLSERNSSILESLQSALTVWNESLKPSDPRLLLARQKLEVFEELLRQEANHDAAC
jgi:tetratricopeptide (TPR) repeat protein